MSTAQNRKQIRAMREINARLTACLRKEEQRKAVPKEKRKLMVRLSRAEKMKSKSHFDTFVEEDDQVEIYSQSGLFTGCVLAASATTVAASISHVCNKASVAIDGASTKLSTIMDTVYGKFNAFVSHVKSFVGDYWVIPVALFLFCLLNQVGASPLLSVCLTALGSHYLSGGGIWERIKSFLPLGEIETQSGLSDSLPFIATLVCTFMVPAKDPTYMASEIMRRMSMSERSSGGFTFMFDNGLRLVETVVNTVLGLLGKENVSWTDQTDRMLREWAKKVDAFELLTNAGNPTIGELQDAIKLQQEGIGMRQTIKSQYAQVFLTRYLDRLTGSLQAHRGVLNSASAFRQQPIMAMLGGASGVGKTSALKALASYVLLLAREVKAKDAIQQMWQKGITEYWNGYVQQKCLIMDDCFQLKADGSQPDNEAMLMIRAVGNWAFPLNFADVESKGRFYFTSPLIIGTTNVKNIKELCNTMVNHPTAVTRRIQYGYWVHVSPAYRRGNTMTLDYEKVEREHRQNLDALQPGCTNEDVFNAFPWQAWTIIPHNFEGDCPDYQPCEYGFKELAMDMAKELQERAKKHAESVENLSTWLEKLESVLPQSGFTPRDEALRDVFASRVVEPEEIFHDIEPMTVSADEEISEGRKAYTEYLRDFGKRALEILSLLYRRWIGDEDPSKAAYARFTEDASEGKDFFTQAAQYLTKLGIFVAVGYLVTIVLCFVSAVVCGVAKALWSVIGRLFKGIVPQSNTKSTPEKPRNYMDYIPRFPTSQLGCPPEDHRQEKIYQNTYKMMIGDETVGQILFIEGQLAVMPCHYRKDLLRKIGENITFYSCCQDRFTFNLSVERFLDLKNVTIPDVDVNYVLFKTSMLKAHSHISHFFFSESQMSQVLRQSDTPVRLDVARVHDMGGERRITRQTFVSGYFEPQKEIHVAGFGRSCFVVKYAAPTVVGDCGSPLMLCEPRYWGGKCMIGIHVAGSTGAFQRNGYATLITEQNIIQARALLGGYSEDLDGDLASRGVTLNPLSGEESEALRQSGLVGGSFVPIGKVDKPLNMASVSKIKKSPMYGVFGPSPTLPARLGPVEKDGVTIWPMAKAVEAYQSTLEYREIPLMDSIVALATQKHWEATERSDRSLLTFEEAIVPPENMKLKKIARDTSCGYPYRLDGGAGKRDFFGDGDEYDLTGDKCQDLKARVMTVVSAAKRNERLAHLFTDFLKDELRPLAKVEAVATRAISGAPLDYVVAVRMYFGSFLAAMFNSHVESGMAPGINHYTEWHLLAEKLIQRGDKVFGGDFSRFDASEQPYIHVEILKYINRWYRHNNPMWREDDERVRDILWLDLIHSRHLTGLRGKLDTVVQWNKSLPSGHPLTTPVNSLYCLITLTACYVHATGDVRDMWKRAYICSFGDDNVNSTSDAVADVFNQVTVSRLMKELFNLTYTSDKKEAELKPYEDITDVTFLKRSFSRDPLGSGGWTGPLAFDSFMYIPYWFKNPRVVRDDLTRNVEQMLGELCLHDESVWEKYFPVLDSWCSEAGFSIPTTVRTRDSARGWISTRSDVWF